MQTILVPTERLWNALNSCHDHFNSKSLLVKRTPTLSLNTSASCNEACVLSSSLLWFSRHRAVVTTISCLHRRLASHKSQTPVWSESFIRTQRLDQWSLLFRLTKQHHVLSLSNVRHINLGFLSSFYMQTISKYVSHCATQSMEQKCKTVHITHQVFMQRLTVPWNDTFNFPNFYLMMLVNVMQADYSQ